MSIKWKTLWIINIEIRHVCLHAKSTRQILGNCLFSDNISSDADSKSKSKRSRVERGANNTSSLKAKKKKKKKKKKKLSKETPTVDQQTTQPLISWSRPRGGARSYR